MDKDTQPGAEFRALREYMKRPYIEEEPDISYGAPWTDQEWELYVSQEPLPPNHSFQLPSEEQPTNDPNQLHLNYHEH